MVGEKKRKNCCLRTAAEQKNKEIKDEKGENK